MKELVLLRHAKSSWELAVEDRNRPLAETGIKRIKKMALSSIELFEKFEIIYSSPANRALHTACILIHELQLPFEKLQVREQLYTFEASELVHFIKSLPDQYNKVVCVGHNPAFTYAVNELSSNYLNHLPTAGWAHIEFEQSQWKNVQKGKVSIGLPKEILK
jgi:phosphohistidine phosphatase